ncbi:MAG: carboxypeptidase regulatory-like domain-containing protein [Oscillospiraceae bacterium]|nr:carboxypeptidase regulatory-like domain-containing protein [Oscillospiraceae bacterium]
MHHCRSCIIYCFDKPKGGITLSATGYLQVHAYSSFAQIPLKDVAITVTAPDGTAIAMALTDRSGRIAPISIPAPDFDISQTPDPGQIPFASVTLHARLQGYEQITAENIQIFADTVTYQELEMIPLSELPSQWSKYELFNTPPQQL